MSKIALIIGNADYPESPLLNPVNDAIDIEDKLSRLGFQVISLTNVNNKDMEKSLKDFATQLSNQEVALFFFAGHGMQIEGENYLTAIDTDFENEIDAKFSSLSLNKVIETMDKGSNKTDIMILDACRTNPYERRWRGVDSRGLAPVYAPKGMIIAYATSPGQVAFDGDHRNGAYTEAFLKHVSTPDVTIEDLFKRVRNTLSSSTQGRQISWEHTSLMGDFYFNYSFVTDELITEYGDAVIADDDYKAKSGDKAREIIDGLQSHNWYKQNPAIKEINSRTLDKFTKDDLFALGRNIYQAACGTATEAMEYLDDLQSRLSSLEDSVSFHLLNGILFEIYFDSDGKIRNESKSDMLDEVFRLEESEKYGESFGFIRQVLKPYLKDLFYIPSSSRGISVDVICTNYKKKTTVISALHFEGDNVLYDDEGKNYFDPSQDKYLGRFTKDKFIDAISKAFTVPSYKLTINFTGDADSASLIFAPHSLNVKRLGS